MLAVVTHIAVAEPDRLSHDVEDAGRKAGDRAGVVQAVHDHGELVAAEARHQVALAQRSSQPLCDLLEQDVARLVPVGVVDGLEPVQVEQHDCDQLAMAVGARQGLAQIVAEQHAVREAGQLIELRQLGQPPLGAMALDGVADGAVQERRRHLVLGQVVRRAGAHGLEVDLAIPLPGQHDEWGCRAEVDRLAHQLHAIALAQAVVDQVDVVPGVGDRRQRAAP
jgi:hypothetical protein